MTKTIELTDLIVNHLHIDYVQQVVVVDYRMVDSVGKEYDRGVGYFWVTIPYTGQDQNGNPLPVPDNWFQLPSNYIPTLLGLRNDADAALTARFLV